MDGDFSWVAIVLTAVIFAFLFFAGVGLKNQRGARQTLEQKKKVILKYQQKQIRFARRLARKGYTRSDQLKHLMSEFNLTLEQADKVLKNAEKP
jgi:hypothetical protein